MAPEGTVTVEGTTQDTGESVYRVEVGDAWANVIPTDDLHGHTCVLVHHIEAVGETRMRDLLDFTVDHFGISLLVFVTIVNRRLPGRLDGFTAATWGTPRGQTDVLVGQWHSPSSRADGGAESGSGSGSGSGSRGASESEPETGGST